MFVSVIWKWLAAACALGFAAAVSAQPWPAKPVRILIPFAPGGAPDIVARLTGPKLSEALGQPFVVENRPGAAGAVAAAAVAGSPPDGYTLFMTTVSTQAIAPAITPNLPYDPQKDFAPISLAAVVPLVLFVPASSSATNVRELIALLRAAPGKYSYGSSGAGAPLHLAAELFKSMTGTVVEHIPYRGSVPALVDLVAGRTAMQFDVVAAAQPHLDAGTLRAIGVGTRTRAPGLPAVPTIGEAGLPGFEAYTWVAFFAPAQTPQPLLGRLNAEFRRALQAPDVSRRLTELGFQVVGSTQEELARHVEAEIRKWSGVVRAANIKIEP